MVFTVDYKGFLELSASPYKNEKVRRALDSAFFWGIAGEDENSITIDLSSSFAPNVSPYDENRILEALLYIREYTLSGEIVLTDKKGDSWSFEFVPWRHEWKETIGNAVWWW